MSPDSSSPVIALLGLALWCPLSLAQETETAPPDARKGAAREEAPIDLVGPEPNLPENFTRVRDGLNAFAMPVLAFRPERIAPGEGGQAHLVLVLQKAAVLKVGTHFQLVYERAQGPVRLGDWQLEEPKIGELPTRFKGHVVYDNTATVVIPVVVDAAARGGSYPVSIRVEADVTDGDTARFRGRFRADARAELAVGPPIPRPNPIVSSERSSGGDVVADTTALVRDSGSTEVEGPLAEPPAVGDRGPAPAAPTTGGDDAGRLEQPEDSTAWLPIVLAGALLLGLIVAAARGRAR